MQLLGKLPCNDLVVVSACVGGQVRQHLDVVPEVVGPARPKPRQGYRIFGDVCRALIEGPCSTTEHEHSGPGDGGRFQESSSGRHGCVPPFGCKDSWDGPVYPGERTCCCRRGGETRRNCAPTYDRQRNNRTRGLQGAAAK